MKERNFNRFFALTAGIGLVSLMFSCEKDSESTGSNVISAGPDFKVEQFALQNGKGEQVQNSIKINEEEGLVVNASFSDSVTATVEFLGISSGAKKTVSVNAKELNASNLLWSGAQDEGVFFQKDEQVAVKLSFHGTEVEYLDTVSLTEAYDFKTENTAVLDNGSFDFDYSIGSNWWTNIGANVSSPYSTIESEKYAVLKGKACEDCIWVGETDYDAFDGDYITLSNGSALPSDPSRVWFNIYVYGTGEETPSNLSIQFYEAEEESKHQLGKDDGVLLTIPTSHEGWKLFSYKYSDLGFSTYVEYDNDGNPVGGGGNGNKLHQPHQIDLIAFGLEATEKGGEAQAYFDFPIFTVDGPFDPSEY